MKVFTGKVESVKNQKTAIVVVNRLYAHSVYHKRIKRTKRYPVHDEMGVSVGQTVKFIASKPYSKTKRWKITEVVKISSAKKTSKKSTKKAK